MALPILDQQRPVRPHDYQFMRIQTLKGVVELVYPVAYKTTEALLTAPRDQDFRGTCVGQSIAYLFDILHMVLLGKVPTDAEKAQFKKNVVDQIGTTHDVLYYPSASAECAYQMSRYIGNVTYPAGSEIRYAVRALQKYGMVREDQWHTDKKGTMVWMYPPGPRVTNDGGISPEEAFEEASKHVIDGYGMCGTPDGGASWEEVCYAIFTKKVVLGAIPVYENYSDMQGGDGTFPFPGGNIAGYHALCFYGYDEEYLYFLHSWGDWCGRYGRLSREYFQYSIDQSVWMVVLDAKEVEWGAQTCRTIEVQCTPQATVMVDGVMMGQTPYKFSAVPKQVYRVELTAPGYVSKVVAVDDSTTSVLQVVLDLTPPQPVKGWLQILLELWNSLIALFRRK